MTRTQSLFRICLVTSALMLVACGDDDGGSGDGGTGMDGSAMCGAGETDCGGACVDTSSDPGNCGACGTACTGGQVCDMGACADMCSGGLENCSGACVDTQTSPANCGSCGNACAAGETCSAGMCSGACTANGDACSAAGDCCSGACEGGLCVPMAGCSATGEACTAAADCCSSQCNNSAGSACMGEGDCVCAPSTACVASEGACTSDAQCCNSLCDRPDGAAEGTCASLGACLTRGEPCGSEGLNGSCCSTVCLDTDGTGARCQFLGGCRVQDDLCSADGECCSGVCADAGMTRDGRPIRRCANAGSCLPPGEVCGDGGASSNCCPNGGGDTGCEPTGGGFRRCLGGDGSCVLPGRACMNTAECCMESFPNIMCQEGPTGENVCCLADGEDCAFGDICCSGICTPDPTDGALRCGAMCIPDGQACTVDSDCCGCGCVSDGMGGQVCTSDAALCDPCMGPGLGEFCDPMGTPCCEAPAVVCTGTNEFATCQLAP